MNNLFSFYRDCDDGQGLAEYGLIISLIAIVVVITIIGFGDGMKLFYSTEIIDKLP